MAGRLRREHAVVLEKLGATGGGCPTSGRRHDTLFCGGQEFAFWPAMARQAARNAAVFREAIAAAGPRYTEQNLYE